MAHVNSNSLYEIFIIESFYAVIRSFRTAKGLKSSLSKERHGITLYSSTVFPNFQNDKLELLHAELCYEFKILYSINKYHWTTCTVVLNGFDRICGHLQRCSASSGWFCRRSITCSGLNQNYRMDPLQFSSSMSINLE